MNSALAVPPHDATANELFDIYHCTLFDLADQFAPAHCVRSHYKPLTPWFDADCLQQRRRCRALEQRYRRTNSPLDRLAWVDALRGKHAKLREKEKAYWLLKIAAASGSPSKLWRSLASILHRDKTTGEMPASCSHSADDMLSFFNAKVSAVRDSTAGATFIDVLRTASSTMTELRTYSVEEVRKIIMGSPVKSCALDPIPTFLLRDVIDALLPFLTAMCNASLQEGYLPVSQRHGIVLPLLKKSSLDPSDKKNYRPVSNLTFMSTVIERMVTQQVTDYL